MLKLKHILNELNFGLVHTTTEGGMSIVHETKQMPAGHFSKRMAIKLSRDFHSKLVEFRNSFISATTRHNIFNLAIPRFTEIRPRLDPHLDGKCYGPTNEKLASYTKKIFGSNNSSSASKRWASSETPGLEQNEGA